MVTTAHILRFLGIYSAKGDLSMLSSYVELDNLACIKYDRGTKEAWPSGKAGACKALIPSSNLGASCF